MITLSEPKLKFCTGNQMIAEGAVRAGCRFFAGYPITPASGIYKSMIDLLQRSGDVAISAPDEISALAYCVGASMRGFKSMTATSGPGWALMIETVQYALMTETPVVIAFVQRLGPSTGGATQGAQGDILLSEFCTSGGYTIPILCPSTPVECFDLTHKAFAWAEMLRTPVIVLSDKEVGMTSECVDFARLGNQAPPTRKYKSDFASSKMYDFAERDDVPEYLWVGGMRKVTATGSAHNKSGELKKNDAETLEVLHHLEEKIRSRRSELTVTTFDGQAGAETLVVSFGITARTMREAVRNVRMLGRKASALSIQSLFPVPEEKIKEAMVGISRIVIAEENFSGQYRSVLAPLMYGKEVVGVNKIGSMIMPAEIEVQIV
jgi:2-oxoglutarate ferredoxin oxidoreductase subunit alpha